jgi:hypothetical protein
VIDFDLPDDVRALRARTAAFIDTHVLPAEAQIGTRPYFDIVDELQTKARAEGLWCPFVPTEWGGMGLGHLAKVPGGPGAAAGRRSRGGAPLEDRQERPRRPPHYRHHRGSGGRRPPVGGPIRGWAMRGIQGPVDRASVLDALRRV